MSRLLEELRKILSQGEISLEDQNDLLVFLPILPQESLEKLIKLFQKNIDAIKEFNQNFKSKLKVLAGKSDEEWDKVVKEEEEKLKEMESELGMKPEETENEENFEI